MSYNVTDDSSYFADAQGQMNLLCESFVVVHNMINDSILSSNMCIHVALPMQESECGAAGPTSVALQPRIGGMIMHIQLIGCDNLSTLQHVQLCLMERG